MMPIRNAPSALPTTLRFIASRLAHRVRNGSLVPATAEFSQTIERVLHRLQDQVARLEWVTVNADGSGWIEAKAQIAAGQAVSIIADGRVFASRGLDLAFEARMGLWYRVSGCEVRNVSGNACTFVADSAGNIQFVAKPPGEFLNREGEFDPQVPRDALSGAFKIAVIVWRGDPVAALQAAIKLEPRWFSNALERLQQPVTPPAGWHYLWRLGTGDIFSAGEKGKSEVCCHTRADVGILQFPVDRPLTAESRIDWTWCVEQLPSKLAEHIEPTHDYLSLAVEFDNGLDLTWMWSAALPVDTIFQCPLAWWKDRETHWVIRSGTQELGRSLNESRSLQADYEKAIGGPLPKRIVGVWLIANTVFQRGEGKVRYSDIQLVDANGAVNIAQD